MIQSKQSTPSRQLTMGRIIIVAEVLPKDLEASLWGFQAQRSHIENKSPITYSFEATLAIYKRAGGLQTKTLLLMGAHKMSHDLIPSTETVI